MLLRLYLLYLLILLLLIIEELLLLMLSAVSLLWSGAVPKSCSSSPPKFKVAPSSAVTFVAYEACFRALTRLAESWEREELLRAQLELEAPDTATA